MLLGSLGEKLASDYLQNKGYHILQKNFRSRYGEIDIIGKIDHTVVFVEVKTRRSDIKGKPYTSVTARKLNHQKKAVNWYLSTRPETKLFKLRFDIISIEMDYRGKPKIEHFENIDINF